MVTLYCEEAPELKLGPGAPPGAPVPVGTVAGEIVIFHNGFADVAPEDLEKVMAWARAGAPPIEILDGDEGRVLPATPGSIACARCGKAFESKKKLNGHMMSHR